MCFYLLKMLRILSTALGQIMLYVDGMTGVSNSLQTLQWLYSLIDSKFRLVIKTALKLLIVFVEYSEYNALMLTKAIAVVDKSAGKMINLFFTL